MDLVRAVWGAIALVIGLIVLFFIVLIGICILTEFIVYFSEERKSRKERDRDV